MSRRSSLPKVFAVAVFVIIVAVLGIAAGCSSGVVARVNGEKIMQAEFDAMWNQVVAQLGEEPTGTVKTQYQQQVLDYLIESKLVESKAKALGADLSDKAIEDGIVSMVGTASADASLQAQLESLGMTVDDLREQVRYQLSQNFLYDYVSNNTTVTTLPETYTLLEHILVSSETTANALYKQLQTGADFATLAKEYSSDTYSASNGGSLGWAPLSAWVTEFATASSKLATGQISAPVQSDYGWHIIRKVSECTTGTPIADCPDDVVTTVTQSAASDAYYAFIKDLKASAKIEYVDKSLEPTSTAN